MIGIVIIHKDYATPFFLDFRFSSTLSFPSILSKYIIAPKNSFIHLVIQFFSGKEQRYPLSAYECVYQEIGFFLHICYFSGPRPFLPTHAIIFCISSGFMITAITDISPPQRGQVKISISYTLDRSRAHALRRVLSETLTASGSCGIPVSEVTSLPYHPSAARKKSAGLFFHVPLLLEE